MADDPSPAHAARALRLESYRVRLEVDVESESLLPEVLATLPPGWVACDEHRELAARLAITESSGGSYSVTRDELTLAAEVEREIAIGVLDASIRAVVAEHAPDRVFIHAGVAAVEDRAIILPGLSFSGKTTLVAALIRLGARYLSDEYAVLDQDGQVHPYSKPLSIRPQAGPRGARAAGATDVAAHELGAITVDRALPIGLIATTNYRPGASWNPETRTPAQGALSLLSHAVAVREDPVRVLAAVRAGAAGATVIEGERGEAEDAAHALIAILQQR